MPQRRLLERLTVASLLIYPSRPSTPADREAIGVVFAGIKQGSARHLARAAQRLSELPAEHPVRHAVPPCARHPQRHLVQQPVRPERRLNARRP